MDNLEVRARTVEEATNRALQQLGLDRDQVAVTVVREGRGGILGLGAEDAIVRVTPLAAEEPQEEREQPALESNRVETTAVETLQRLLDLLDIDATVEVQTGKALTDEEDSNAPVPVSLNIAGDDLGILIGRRGQTLSSLQYVLRILVGRKLDSWAPIVVDVERYKQRRHEALIRFAEEMADRVKARGASFTLEPMPAFERRVIHIALADHPAVTTESIGEGDDRKVVIRPKKKPWT
jgi:spoIIIJ-associated protein